MIVALDVVKRALGLSETDTSQDETLTELQTRVVAWIQGEIQRRFDTPELLIAIVEGKGSRRLYLPGHRDPANATDESAGTLSTISVRERGVGDSNADWEDLVEDEDFEVRGDILYKLGGFGFWDPNMEYELTFYNGYVDAPEDIKALVMEMMAASHGADAALVDGTAGITSEKLGDYSYTLGSSTGDAGASGGGVLSLTGSRTINRWKRQLV